MSSEEKALFRKISEQLLNKDDQIALSQVHNGDWLFACINPADEFSSMELETVTVKNVTVLNDAYPQSNEGSWGLYFVYAGNKIEYYAFPNSKILADPSRGWSDENKNCAKRKNAVLKVKDVYHDILQVSLMGD